MSELPKNDPNYIQFSKRLTRWALTLCTVAFLFCLLSVVLAGLNQYSTTALVTLYTTFCTVQGVIVSGYHGNSSLEKYQRMKTQVEGVMPKAETNTGSTNG